MPNRTVITNIFFILYIISFLPYKYNQKSQRYKMDWENGLFAYRFIYLLKWASLISARFNSGYALWVGLFLFLSVLLINLKTTSPTQTRPTSQDLLDIYFAFPFGLSQSRMVNGSIHFSFCTFHRTCQCVQFLIELILRPFQLFLSH